MNFRNFYLILMGLGIIILTTIISLIEIKIGFVMKNILIN